MSAEQAIVKVQMGSERNFGLIIGAVFVIIGCWPLIHGGDIRPYWLIAAAALFAAGLFAPSILYWPNRWWFKFGLLLGAIVAPIVMALVYIIVFLPIGMILRVRKADLLRLRMEPDAPSYWIERDAKPQSMTRQF